MNPEELFVGSISACQALTFLAMAVRRDVSVTMSGYADVERKDTSS